MSMLVVGMLSACGAKSTSTKSSPSPAASSSGEIKITHPLGTATVKKNPQKIAVFDYATLDTLNKLGIEVSALPKATLPKYLSKYNDAKYTEAGTLFEPDFEKLNKLKPDVIFIGARTAAAYKELEKIAPTIQMSLDYTKYADSFAANLNVIGQVFGKEKEVASELKTINSSIADLKAKSGSSKTLIVLTTGGKTSAYGLGSRFSIIHDSYGFTPVDSKIEVSPHGQSISNEYIAEKNPDVLFVIDRDTVAGGAAGAAPAKTIIENDLVKKTNAYKNGRIVYLDANYWYLSGGGLQSDLEMVKEATQAIK
nr:siderophore ABC transporter substrate-binding protein [Paenibacillus qinlingensis]